MLKPYIKYGLSYVMTDPKKSEQAGKLIDMYKAPETNETKRKFIGYVLKTLVFNNFCGGETVEACNKTIDNYSEQGISTVLDYAVEGESTQEKRDETMKELLTSIEHIGASTSPHKIAVFKPTAIADIQTLASISSTITKRNINSWEEYTALFKDMKMSVDHKVREFERNCEELFEQGKRHKVSIFIDAEKHKYQAAIDLLMRHMMKKYNRDGQCIVINTVQCYKKDVYNKVQEEMNLAEAGGYIYAVKLVRGAYMDEERELASKEGYEPPIHETKEDTDKAFNDCLSQLLEDIDISRIYLGTHNIESIGITKAFMEGFNIEKNDPRIHFGQLHGMGDHLSDKSAKEGYNVFKYLPYGEFKETIAYLKRRQEENNASSNLAKQDLEHREKNINRLSRKVIEILSGKVLDRQTKNVITLTPTISSLEVKDFFTLEKLFNFLETSDHPRRSDYREVFMKQDIKIIKRFFSTYPEIDVSKYLNNYPHILSGGYTRRLFEEDTIHVKNRDRFGDDNITGYSKKYLDTTPHNFFQDIDDISQIKGISLDNLKEQHKEGWLDNETVKSCFPVYIALRAIGYSHRDLGGQEI